VSLGVFQNSDITDYMRGGKFATGETGGAATWLSNADQGDTRNGQMWLDRLGLIQSNFGGLANYARIDPLGIDNSSDAIKRLPALGLHLHIGAFVPSTGEQRLFGVTAQGSPGNPWQLVDYNDPTNILDTNIFPNVTQRTNTVAGFTSGDVGWYDTGDDTEWLFFEGWDHDSSGNAAGTALITNSTIRDATALYTQITGLVNLTTGFATPLLEMPSLYKTLPDNDGQAGELFGESVLQFKSIQFVADDDSRANAPKGQIFLSAYFSTSGRHYGIWIEWNPSGATGSPLRSHLSERLVSRFTVSLEASNASFPGKSSNEVPSTASGSAAMKINRQTGRPFIVYSEEAGSAADFFTNFVFHSTIMEATQEAVTDQVTKPSERQAITTNRIIIIGSEAVGDLGERVAGQDVAWSLARISTRGEVMNIPATPPTDPYTVDNVPIDRNSNFPFDVLKDGVPLTETTHYTVDEALGQISWAGSEDPPSGSSIYSIDYAHPTVEQSPPFGQLLVATAITDENGEAFTRVRYLDEDLNEGFVDQLTVDTA
jgi:hypothetical protein